MSVEISRTCKFGRYTKQQYVHLLNGEVVVAPVCVDAGSFSTGRTIWLKGGDVRVRHDGDKWIECNPGRKD